MPKQIIGGTFEILGQAAQQAGQQVGQQVGPGKILEQAAQQVGLKPTETGTEQVSGGQQTKTQSPLSAEKVAQKKAMATQRIKQLEAEIEQIRKQREQKTLQERVPEKPVEAGRKITQLAEEKEKPLPPPAVSMAQRSAGAERRIKGASG